MNQQMAQPPEMANPGTHNHGPTNLEAANQHVEQVPQQPTGDVEGFSTSIPYRLSNGRATLHVQLRLVLTTDEIFSSGNWGPSGIARSQHCCQSVEALVVGLYVRCENSNAHLVESSVYLV